MRHQEWHERYVSMLAAYAQRPSDDLIRRAAELGDALVRARVSPQDFVAAHMACVEQLCASRAGGDGTALRGATSLLLEVMKAYGRRLQEPRGTPRPLAEQTDRLNETLADAEQAQQAVPGGNSELRRRLEQRTAELAVANERLQQEIAERKQTEQVLRESEARYRRLFATVSDAIVVFDGETKQFVGVNDAAVRLYGYSREELLRLGLLDISAQPEESRIAAEEALDDGFYDGTIFHRVLPEFVVQGGGLTPDLAQKETRPPIANEASNGLSNVRGTVAMAGTDDPNSATAQFFVNVIDNLDLDADEDTAGYAVFGRVVEGMDVVDSIAAQPTEERDGFTDVPVEDVVIERIEFVTLPTGQLELTPEGQTYLELQTYRVSSLIRELLVQLVRFTIAPP